MTERNNIYIQPVIFLFYLIVGFIFFWKPILSGEPFFGEDFIWQYLPMNHTALELMHSGEWPLWNPYLMSGMPLFASLTFALFYPGTLLLMYLPQHEATTLLYWLHTSLAGYFTYRFFRVLQENPDTTNAESNVMLKARGGNLYLFPAIFSGLFFMFAGNLVTLIYPGHTMKYYAIALLPMIMFCLGKSFQSLKLKWFSLTALALSIQFFTTHLQVCYYTWILVFLFSFFKLLRMFGTHFQANRLYVRTHSNVENYSPSGAGKIIFYLVLTGILIVGLTAVQWIPFWEYTKYCVRSGGMDYESATEASFPPEEIASMFIVSPFGDQVHPFGNAGHTFVFESQSSVWGKMLFPAGFQNYTGRFNGARTLSEYLGVLPFLLGLFGVILSRRKYPKFFLVVLIISFLLCMGRFIFLDPLFLHIIPGLSMFRVPAEILILFTFSLAILAGTGLEEIVNMNPLSIKAWKKVLGIVISAAIIFFIVGLYVKTQHYHGTYIRFLLLAFISLGLIYWLIKKRNLWSPILLGVLFIFDMWSAHQPYLQMMEIEPYDYFIHNDPAVQAMQQDSDTFRFLPLGSSDMVNNKWMFNEIQSVWGYHSFPLRNYAEYWSTLGFDNPTLRKMLNVKYVLSNDTMENLILKYNFQPNKYLYMENEVAPRVWLVDAKNMQVISNNQKVLGIMKDKEFNPFNVVILEKSSGPFAVSGKTVSSSTIESLRWSPQKIEVSAQTNQPAFLVLSEIYYPGWIAQVDNQPAKIYRADSILRAVQLSPGAHKIQMTFSPFMFYLGLWISILSLVLFICSLFMKV